jgi:hypothetical protein
VSLPPEPARVPVASVEADPIRRSRTAARRLRRRHLRTAASGPGVNATMTRDGDHQAGEATGE